MPPVLADDAGAVRVLTLNRPEARNALNSSLIEDLYAALCAADADPSIRAVVLTEADPAFCAGVDLKQAQSERSAYFERYQTHNCITKVAEMATPVVGAIKGPVFTGGLEMAWAATSSSPRSAPCSPIPMPASASCPAAG